MPDTAPVKDTPPASESAATPEVPVEKPQNSSPITASAIQSVAPKPADADTKDVPVRQLEVRDEKPTAPAATKAAPPVEVDSDEDDEEDLDDLDDLLDEFDEPEKKLTTESKVPAVAPETAPVLDEDWAKQLQAGMADLLNEMGDNEEMQAQFDILAKELNDAMASATAAETAPATTATAGPSAPKVPVAKASTEEPVDFQARLKAAMDKMSSSEADANAAVADSGSDDFLAEMLKQLQGQAGAGGDEDFSGMLVNMMEQLTSKEILYEPMKELSVKYPEWLEKNVGKEKEEDMKRYRDQYAVVKEIVDKFEEKDYSDDSEPHRDFIVERMQKMQSAGAPPTELMGDVPPELGAGLPDDIDPDCGVQ